MFHKICPPFRIGLAVLLSVIVQNLQGINYLQKDDSTTFLSDCHVVFLGDSNLWTGGKDNSDPHSWSYWFCKELSIKNSRNYARSGPTREIQNQMYFLTKRNFPTITSFSIRFCA